MPKRLHVLFLTHRLPYAPNRGDRVRAYHMLRTLHDRVDTTLVSLVHDRGEAAQASRLAPLTVQTVVAPVPRLLNHARAAAALLSAKPLTSVLLDSPVLMPSLRRLRLERPVDVVLAYCSSMARFALDPTLADIPLVIDMVDADSAKWDALAPESPWPRRWVYRREARVLRMLEATAMRHAFATVAVNDREVAHLRALAPDARIEVLGVGADLSRLAPEGPPLDSARVVFCGVMSYEPNEAGAVWLARDIWPRVRRTVPWAELRIVGASPTRRVRALEAPGHGIVVTGTVPDVRPELWNGAVAAAPLHAARGVQTKVLEAVAAGLPCVVTSAVAGGLPAPIMPACRVADTTEEFAAALVEALGRSPSERRSLATVDLAELTWDRTLTNLVPLLVDAARRRA